MQGGEVKLDICGTKQFHLPLCSFLLHPFAYRSFPKPSSCRHRPNSKTQAKQACRPRGMACMSVQLLQLPIPHFTRPFCCWDMFTLPRQAFQQGSLGPRACIPAAPPWNWKLLSQQHCRLRRPYVRIFPQGFSLMWGKVKKWESGLIPSLESVVLNQGW